jgi:hypothetical protein
MGAAKPSVRRADRTAWVVAALLAVFLATQYGYALRVPFINDDFVFLDKTRGMPIRSVWEPHVHWVGRYYRPWSRELHYWLLQRVFGAREAPFHMANYALWLGTMVLYFLLVRRLAGLRTAGVATACAAALAAWGVPVVWAAGAQDLWMIFLATTSLLLLAHGRGVLAALAFSLSLASKETAALLPALGLALVVFVEARPLRAALRRVAPLLAVGVVWAILHPQVGGRLWHPAADVATDRFENDPVRAILQSLLATANLIPVPRPESGWFWPLLWGVVGALSLVALAGWTLLRRGGRAEVPPRPRGLAVFALIWVLAGWLPLCMPTILWHAYYGLFGMLGAWLLLGMLLARRPGLALAVVVALALLRSSQAATVSCDWGDESYPRRAAEYLTFMKRDLIAKAPTVAPHTRFFFLVVPSNVGFLQGDGPALRIWYRDSTLTGGLLSTYRVRPADAPAGTDRFFRYDSTTGWIEVRPGREAVDEARAADPLWRDNHERLALALAGAGEWPAVIEEYSKLASAFPEYALYPYYAGLACLVQGDSVAARTWRLRAASLPTADDRIRAAARDLDRAVSRTRRSHR